MQYCVAKFLNYLILAFRPDMEKMAGILDLKKIEGKKYGQSHYLDIQDTIPIKGKANVLAKCAICK